jgi:positive phototaxis protein PixI
MSSQFSELQDILTLARQGDPGAISTLINHSLNSRGITAKIGWNNQCLGILLESAPVPDQEEMIAFIRQNLSNLQPAAIRLVKVCGYQPGQSLPAWYEEIEMEGISAIVPEEYSTPSLASWLNQGLAPRDGHEGADSLYGSLSAQLAQSLESVTKHAGLNRPHASDELRFLRFYFNDRETALLPLSRIQQVLKVPVAEILPVPHMADCVLGIYNWRGEMLWLVDLAQQLGFSSSLTEIRSRDTVTAIAIQTEHKFLGVIVPQLRDVETHSADQLQPPTSVFPAKLLAFMKGYFISSSSPVLDATALMQDPRLQVHCCR